jgi:hypothetical protein
MFSKKQPCPKCKASIQADFDFCPHCGCDIRDPEKDLQDYGLLGKNDMVQTPTVGGGSMGFSDKLINSIFTQLMKSLEQQMRAGTQQPQDGHSEVRKLPNGIVMTVNTQRKAAPKAAKRKILSEEQMKRMAALPRTEAKTDIRRLSDRVLYELKTPGVGSVDDVIVSKVESGYEVKVISDKKVYINSLQLDLPLKGYSLNEQGVTFEFALQ